MSAVDIIIPIHSGFEDIGPCMERVLRNTDLTTHRVILIKSQSTDPRMLPLLKHYVGDHVTLMEAPRDQGFFASANQGISCSDADVILLSPDTLVTPGWVEHITACAESAPEIGTVTPLSNRAAGDPAHAMEQGQIPLSPGSSIEDYAGLVERCSLRRYPRIPVAGRFCMFIKREVIRWVGLFDTATFGEGYGEEYDFCNRAEQYGYIHVLCDDTYVYHKGTAWDGPRERPRQGEQYDGILQQRYPKQMPQHLQYGADNPDQSIWAYLHLCTELHNGRRNLLYLVHGDFQEDLFCHPGGTEYHVRDLTMGLRERYNVFVLCRAREDLRLTIYRGQEATRLTFPIGPAPAFQRYTDRRLKGLFRLILSAFRIDWVHIHHVLGLSLDLFDCAHEMKIPVVASLHDYFYICPTITLLDQHGHFCVGTWTPEGCADCLRQKLGIATQVDYLRRWRQENGRALSLCQALIVPSQPAADLFLRTFPALADRIRVIPHGSDPQEASVEAPQVGEILQSQDACVCVDKLFDQEADPDAISGWAFLKYVDSSQVKVIVGLTEATGETHYIQTRQYPREDVQRIVGQGNPLYLNVGFSASVPREQFAPGELKVRILLQHQGQTFTDGTVQTVQNAPESGEKRGFRVAFLGAMVPAKGSNMAYELITRSKSDIQWFIFGSVENSRLASVKQDNLTRVGSYQRNTICRLLKEHHIDLICILPTCAETFCYTLSEAWLAGIPVLVTDIGAVGARVRETGAGIVVPLDATPEEILDHIQGLRAQPERYQRLKEALAAMPMRGVQDMVADYIALYEGLPDPQRHYGPVSYEEVFRAVSVRGASYSEADLEALRQELNRLRENVQRLT